MARLVVNPSSAGAWEIQLKPGDNFIGRGFSNDFSLNDPSVSGSHCQIHIEDDAAWIKDLGSTNGTYVEHAPVLQAVLKNGQLMHVGRVEMVFYSEGPGALPSPLAANATAGTDGSPRTASPNPVLPTTSQLPPLPPALPKNAPRISRIENRFQRPPEFFKVVWSAFTFPLKGDGIMLLAAGTAFFAILNAAKFFARFSGLFGLVAIGIVTVIGTGYLTCYLQRIITGTATGDDKMPDWPDVTDVSSDIIGPFLQFAATCLASFLPAIIALGHLSSGSPWSTPLLVLALVYGAIYFPMAFLAVAMLDTVFALNPLAVVPPIFRMPVAYLFSCFLFAGVLVLWWAGAYFFTAFIQIRFLSSVLFGFAQLYFLTVGVRVLGLLYWTHKGSFGWLNR